MFNDDEQIQANRELQWLAHYYQLHGHEQKAKEIQETMLRRSRRRASQGAALEMLKEDEQRRRAS